MSSMAVITAWHSTWDTQTANSFTRKRLINTLVPENIHPSGRQYFEMHFLESKFCISFKYTEVYSHDDVIKWKHFPRYWPFVREIHRSPVNSPHKGQWRGALMFTLICARINGWVNNREAGDLRCNPAHYDVIVMLWIQLTISHMFRGRLASNRQISITWTNGHEIHWGPFY